MPVGSVLAKEGFEVGTDGSIRAGPLFIMAKTEAGTGSASGGWRYRRVTADGSVHTDAALQQFCNGCHKRAKDDDFMMFLPDDHRASVN